MRHIEEDFEYGKIDRGWMGGEGYREITSVLLLVTPVIRAAMEILVSVEVVAFLRAQL